MKHTIIKPTLHTSHKYLCAGVYFQSINNLHPFITYNGSEMYLSHSEPYDAQLLERMVSMYPEGRSLYYSDLGQVQDVQTMYKHNKSCNTKHKQEVINQLFYSLYLYFLIRKHT